MPNEVVTRLRGDTAPLQRDLGTGERAIRNYANRVTGVMRNLSTSLAGFFAIHKLTSFTQQVHQLALEADDAASKFETVFGPAINKVNRFVDEFANKAGFAKHELKDLLGTSGNILQGLGATADQSAALAEDMARLAGDVASFNGATKDTPQVLHALQSALTGEREALKTYGIVITEAEVQTVALGMSGKKTAKDLTALEKAAATVELAYKKAAKAAGDLERTQNSASNKAAKRAAEWKDLKVQIGEALAPAFEQLGDAQSELLTGLAESGPLIHDITEATKGWGVSLRGVVAEMGYAVDGLTNMQLASAALLGTMDSFDLFGLEAEQAKARENGKKSIIALRREIQEVGADLEAMEAGKTAEELELDAGTTIDDLRRRIEAAMEGLERAKREASRAGVPTSFIVADEMRARNKRRQAEAANQTPPADRPALPDTPRSKSKPQSDGRAGGSEGLADLYNRISGAAAQNPQVKAVEKVKEAVDAAAEKIVEAIEGEAPAAPLGSTPEQARADHADAISRIMQNRAAEERRRADREARGLGNASRVAAANAEREAKLQEMFLRDVLAGRRISGDGAKAVEKFASGYRTVRGDSGPTIIGSRNRDGRNPTATLDRIREIESFNREAADRAAAMNRQRAIEAAAKQRAESEARIAAASNVLAAAGRAGRAAQSGDENAGDLVKVMRDVAGKLDKVVAAEGQTNQQLQTLNQQIPQIGAMTY